MADKQTTMLTTTSVLTMLVACRC